MDNSDSIIHIALAADLRYKPALVVTAASIVAYADTNVVLLFHILCSGYSESEKREVAKLISMNRRNISFDWIDIEQEVFKQFPSWNCSRMAYARILLPEVLKVVDYVIYSDVDTLWMTDINELWKLREPQCIIKMRRDAYDECYSLDSEYIKRRDNIAIERDSYFCSGISLMNLRLMREDSITASMMNYLSLHPDVPMVDQTVYNAVLGRRAVRLPEKYGVVARYLSPDMFRRQEGFCLHYADYFPLSKLHKKKFISDAQLLWAACYAQIINAQLRDVMLNLFGNHWEAKRFVFRLLCNSLTRKALVVLNAVRLFMKRIPKFVVSCFSIGRKDNYVAIRDFSHVLKKIASVPKVDGSSAGC